MSERTIPSKDRLRLEEHAAVARKRESGLRARCRQMDPTDVLPILSRLALRALASTEGMKMFPLHELAQVFEASCAYFQTYAQKPVAEHLVCRALNELRITPDPSEIASLESEQDALVRFGFLMARQQFGVQGIAAGSSIGRTAHLLGLPTPPPELESGFVTDMGVTPAAWLLGLRWIDAFIGEIAPRRELPMLMPLQAFAMLPQAIPELGALGLDALIRGVARTPDEFGAVYRERRQHDDENPLSPLNWSHHRWQLEDYPGVRTEDGVWFPFPHLISLSWHEALWRRLSQPVLRVVGQRFQEYVRALLRALYGDGAVRELRAPKGKDASRSCDAVCVGRDHVLLVEVKASVPRNDLATPNASVGTGLRRPFEGLDQLRESLTRVRNGEVGADAKDLPALGMVVTLGEYFMGDDPRARKIAAAILDEPWLADDIMPGYAARCCVASVRTLERFVVVRERGGESDIAAMLTDWNSKVHMAVGDFDTFAKHTLVESNGWPQLNDQFWLEFVEAHKRTHARASA